MKIYNNIELGYSYINYCLVSMSEFIIYVLIPKTLNLEINTKELIPIENIEKETDEILGLEEITDVSDYKVYKYYKTFSDCTCFSIDDNYARQYYRRVLIDLKSKNILTPPSA